MVFYNAEIISSAAVTVDSNHFPRPSSWNRDVTSQKRKDLILCVQKQEFRCFGCSSSQQSGGSKPEGKLLLFSCVWTDLIMGCNNKTPWKWTRAKSVWNKKWGVGYLNAPRIICLHQDAECLTQRAKAPQSYNNNHIQMHECGSFTSVCLIYLIFSPLNQIVKSVSKFKWG